MVDFAQMLAELNDPVAQAERTAREKARQDLIEENDRKDNEALTKAEAHWDRLNEKEKSLIGSVRRDVRGGFGISDKQQKWLRDIAARLPEVPNVA